MVLKTTPFGNAFFQLKQLEAKIDHESIFQAMHKLVEQQYDQKQNEQNCEDDIKWYTDKQSQLYKDELESIKNDYYFFQDKLENENKNFQQLQKELKAKQNLILNRQQDIKIFQNELNQDKEDYEQFQKEFLLIKGILEQIKKTFEQQTFQKDYDLVKELRKDLQQQISILKNQNLKMILGRKLTQISQISDYIKQDDQKLEDIKNSYMELLSITEKQKETSLQQVESKQDQFITYKQEAEQDISKTEQNAKEITYLIDKAEENVQTLQNSMQDKQQYLEMLKQGSQKIHTFNQNSKGIYNNKIQEIEDSLDLIRDCMKFMQQPIENLYDDLQGQNDL